MIFSPREIVDPIPWAHRWRLHHDTHGKNRTVLDAVAQRPFRCRRIVAISHGNNSIVKPIGSLTSFVVGNDEQLAMVAPLTWFHGVMTTLPVDPKYDPTLEHWEGTPPGLVSFERAFERLEINTASPGQKLRLVASDDAEFAELWLVGITIP